MLSHDFCSLVFMSGVPFFIHCPKITATAAAAAAAAAAATFFGISQRMENLFLSSEGACACFQSVLFHAGIIITYGCKETN